MKCVSFLVGHSGCVNVVHQLSQLLRYGDMAKLQDKPLICRAGIKDEMSKES